jgi:hypothetical protein
MDEKIKARRFLRRFLREHIGFFKDMNRQHDAWLTTRRIPYVECLIFAFEDWKIIKNDPQHYCLEEGDIRKIQKLFDMIDNFDDRIQRPRNVSEHMRILAHPDWRQIRSYAGEVYDSLKYKWVDEAANDP